MLLHYFNFSHQATPLHWAAFKGHVNAVGCLADKGADINIKDEIGVSESECNADYKSPLQVCLLNYLQMIMHSRICF